MSDNTLRQKTKAGDLILAPSATDTISCQFGPAGRRSVSASCAVLALYAVSLCMIYPSIMA